jgi:hypothetical protein
MPTWLAQALNLLELSRPAIYAIAVYRVFHYLDRQASGTAKKASSDWFQRKQYDHIAVSDATIEMFERLYTKPLLGWRAFVRSALFTVCMSGKLFFELERSPLSMIQVDAGGLIEAVSLNIASDYIALFVVRRALLMGKNSPVVALFVGPAIVIAVVLIFIVVRDVLFILHRMMEEDASLKFWFYDFLDMLTFSTLQGYIGITLAAFAVHLWLPLFGLGVGILELLNLLRIAVTKTQWFLKGGRQHPLDAVGYVAGTLVFIIAVVIQIFGSGSSAS